MNALKKIRFRCVCNKKYVANVSELGKLTRCKRCGHICKITDADSEVSQQLKDETSSNQDVTGWYAAILATSLVATCFTTLVCFAFFSQPDKKPTETLGIEIREISNDLKIVQEDNAVLKSVLLESQERGDSFRDSLVSGRRRVEKLSEQVATLENENKELKKENERLQTLLANAKDFSNTISIDSSLSGTSSRSGSTDSNYELKYSKYKPGLIWVDSYYRDDGTFVRGHWRSKPNRNVVPDRDSKKSSFGKIWVRGYTRKDGTRVRGHWRSR